MYTDNVEAAYIQQRVDKSLAMVRFAVSDCARFAHQTLADNYQQRLIILRKSADTR